MEFKMKLFSLLLLTLFFIGCDDDSVSSDTTENTSWVFVANEGGFFSSNGTVSMIDSFGNVSETESIGDVVQSVLVHEDKLFVAVNNSQKLLVFDISSSGISNMQEITTDGLSPREMVVNNDKLYVTVWDPDYYVYPAVPGNVKVYDLSSFEIISTIQTGIMPEGTLIYDGYLWVANSGEESISKIDMQTDLVASTHSVGEGPQNLIALDSNIYIARRYYDADYNEFHGSSKISISESDSDVTTSNYTSWASFVASCSGSVLNYNNTVYRSFAGGIAPLMEDLSMNESARIGTLSSVYHAEIINDQIWFGITVLSDSGYVANEPGSVKVLDSNGLEIASYDVGINPGDFSYWTK